MLCRAPTSATTCAGGMLTGNKLSYDNKGRLTSWQDAYSSPTTTASYLYDGNGQRVAQKVTASGTTTTTSYVGNLETVTVSGSTGLAGLTYLVTNYQGSPEEALDRTGVVTASRLYGPYGTVRYSNGAFPTEYGYTGQRADAATGLDYYGARYYDPLLAQFTSADTVMDGFNRYTYVGGNPTTATDPSGHMKGAENKGNIAQGILTGGLVAAATLLLLDRTASTAQAPGISGGVSGGFYIQNADGSMTFVNDDDIPYQNDRSWAFNARTAPHTPRSSPGTGGGDGGNGGNGGTGGAGNPPATKPSGAGAPPTGGVPPVAAPAHPDDNGCGCGEGGAIRPLYHGTTWNGLDDIIQNGIRDIGRSNGDPDFYTTPKEQVAVDFSAWRTTPDDPYRALLRFEVPESVLDAMKANGLASEQYFLNSDEVEVRFKPGSWADLMQYLTGVSRITRPEEDDC